MDLCLLLGFKASSKEMALLHTEWQSDSITFNVSLVPLKQNVRSPTLSRINYLM